MLTSGSGRAATASLARVVRWIAWLAVAATAAVAMLAVLNIGGWRARILASLLRVENRAVVVPAPPGFAPTLPPGFQAHVFATGLAGPRWLATAPNGDLFVAESRAGTVLVLRPRPDLQGIASRWVFADNLAQPFGIAFLDDYVYVANTNEVVRFRFDPNTSRRVGGAQHVLDVPGLGYRQHWTRSIAVAPGKRVFVSVGSKTNVSIESDPRRAAILVCDPDGSRARVFATGLRNAVGIAVNPSDGQLWATVNERDNIGDDVPDDFFTRVIDGGFYGWPYSYLGRHEDNRVASRPEKVASAIVPDVLLGAHVAPLQFVFYEGTQFPPRYRSGAFIAEHGSWNRRVRSGYEVVFVPFSGSRPSGPPEPFMTGFVPNPDGRTVYARPVGIALAKDGSLFVSDDGGKVIWRVSFAGGRGLALTVPGGQHPG